MEYQLEINLTFRSVSHDVTTGSKTTEFKSNDKVILWGIKKMFGKKEHFAKFKVCRDSPSYYERHFKTASKIPSGYLCHWFNLFYFRPCSEN